MIFLLFPTSNIHCQILFINVGGLQKGIQGPDFEEFIQNYYIICIQETHFDCFDAISIPGLIPLSFMVKNRAKTKIRWDCCLKDDVFNKIKDLKNSGETVTGLLV